MTGGGIYADFFLKHVELIFFSGATRLTAFAQPGFVGPEVYQQFSCTAFLGAWAWFSLLFLWTGGRGGGRGCSSVACVSRLTVDHVFLVRRSTGGRVS